MTRVLGGSSSTRGRHRAQAGGGSVEQAREAGRRRIATDLHDEVLQDLTHGLQETQLARLRAAGGSPDDAESSIRDFLEVIGESLQNSVEGSRSGRLEAASGPARCGDGRGSSGESWRSRASPARATRCAFAPRPTGCSGARPGAKKKHLDYVSKPWDSIQVVRGGSGRIEQALLPSAVEDRFKPQSGSVAI